MRLLFRYAHKFKRSRNARDRIEIKLHKSVNPLQMSEGFFCGILDRQNESPNRIPRPNNAPRRPSEAFCGAFVLYRGDPTPREEMNVKRTQTGYIYPV